MLPCTSNLVSCAEIKPFYCETVSHKQILLTESIDSLIIGTYNVLFPQPFKIGKFSSSAGYSVTAENALIPNDTWRRQIKIKNILNANPNCLALQEVTQDEFDEYQIKLEGYRGILCLHPNSNHGVAIFYKSAEFHLIGAITGIFQYQVVKTNEYGLKTIIKSRVHLIADLQDKLSGLILRMVSCHLFDPRDWPKEKKCVHVNAVVGHANIKKGYTPDITAICGDMNQDQFGDDVTSCLNEHPKAISWEFISAFRPFLSGYKHDNNLKPTEYDKDLTRVDGEMISTKRKTDWIFLKILSGESKIEKCILENDLRGSDHALILTKIEIKRTFF